MNLYIYSTAYLHISFISSVAMELTSSGAHGAGGLGAVQGFIQDYQLLVLQEGESDMLQYLNFSAILSASFPGLFPAFQHCTLTFFNEELGMGLGTRGTILYLYTLEILDGENQPRGVGNPYPLNSSVLWIKYHYLEERFTATHGGLFW
jgi:hypothetical protein